MCRGWTARRTEHTIESVSEIEKENVFKSLGNKADVCHTVSNRNHIKAAASLTPQQWLHIVADVCVCAQCLIEIVCVCLLTTDGSEGLFIHLFVCLNLTWDE